MQNPMMNWPWCRLSCTFSATLSGNCVLATSRFDPFAQYPSQQIQIHPRHNKYNYIPRHNKYKYIPRLNKYKYSACLNKYRYSNRLKKTNTNTVLVLTNSNINAVPSHYDCFHHCHCRCHETSLWLDYQATFQSGLTLPLSRNNTSAAQ